MFKQLILIVIIISFFSCRKIDLDKSENQLLGKWELVALEIDGTNALSSFKQSNTYFDYLIFYPKTQGGKVYYHNLKQAIFTGNWFLETDSKHLSLGLSQDNTSTYQSLITFGSLPFGGWDVQKLNNNKLILETPFTLDKRYKISFKKVGNFE